MVSHSLTRKYVAKFFIRFQKWQDRLSLCSVIILSTSPLGNTISGKDLALSRTSIAKESSPLYKSYYLENKLRIHISVYRKQHNWTLDSQKKESTARIVIVYLRLILY